MASWILFGGVHSASLAFAFLTLWRLYKYIRRYRFTESKYTLLFGFVHLHWFAVSYIILASAWVLISWGIFTLI